MARRVGSPPEGYKSRVTLFSQYWRVIYPETIKEDGEELLGTCDGKSRTICVSQDQSPESMVDTLVHECMHAYMRMLPGFSDGEPHAAFSGGDCLEEGTVVAATSAMVDLLRSNKWIQKLL